MERIVLRAYLENLSSEVFGADIFKDDSTSYQLDDIGGNFFAIPGLNGKFNIVSKINVLTHFQVRITEKDLKKQNIDILDRICEESQNNCFHLQISKKNIMIRQKTGFFYQKFENFDPNSIFDKFKTFRRTKKISIHL